LSIKKLVVLLHPLSIRERSSLKRRKNFFKKDLVEWKKGCIFAPAKKMRVINEAEKNILKNIW